MSDERTARATLTAVAEPGDDFLNRMIDHCGPEGALEAIRTTRLPQGMSATPQEVRRLDNWRIRLIAAEPDQDMAVCARFRGRLHYFPGRSLCCSRKCCVGRDTLLEFLWLTLP
ncbi:hypothetical protein AB0C69_15855 [Actinomadura sp. NPDC048032]|uniref:hypothetical protein n=1 Tax=Actinomadura sp. NPDC048032 TaxID=3155747 RepID=UPI00340D9F36